MSTYVNRTQTMYSVSNGKGGYVGCVVNPRPKGDPTKEVRFFDEMIDGKPVDLVNPAQLAEDLADYYSCFKNDNEEESYGPNTAELANTVTHSGSRIYIINYVNSLMQSTDNKDLITRGKVLIYQLTNMAV